MHSSFLGHCFFVMFFCYFCAFFFELVDVLMECFFYVFFWRAEHFYDCSAMNGLLHKLFVVLWFINMVICMFLRG